MADTCGSGDGRRRREREIGGEKTVFGGISKEQGEGECCDQGDREALRVVASLKVGLTRNQGYDWRKGVKWSRGKQSVVL